MDEKSILELARLYAQAKGTRVIAFRLHNDGSITIVLESGPKLHLSEGEMRQIVDEWRNRVPDRIILEDGVSADEATLAGKTLAGKRKGK